MSTQLLTLEATRNLGMTFAPTFVEASRERVDVGGVLIDNVDLEQAVQRIDGFLHSSGSHQIVTVNLDFVAVARKNRRFRDTLNSASLAVADGMPVVWVSRMQGEPLPERVTGMTLVDECCRLAVEAERGIFLLGAAPGVADAAAFRLEERFPGLTVVGTYSPPVGPITPHENARMVRMIQKAKPGVLLVALGAPRQDLWIRQNLHLLDGVVAMGVGCVFDVLAGAIDRAPTWMQRSGLEWAYRLGREPNRLWRRYILNDIPVLAGLMISAMRSARIKAPSNPEPLVVQV